MHAIDWRDVDAALMRSLYAREIARWRETLAWDTTAIWPIVEQGRALGTVSGAVVFDGPGEPAGWCFALLQRDLFQVGGFVACSEAATAALLGALAASPAGRIARRWSWFGWFDAAGLAGMLASHGEEMVRYVYLHRALAVDEAVSSPVVGEVVPRSLRAWRASDAVMLPGLLASAYPAREVGRSFAVSGTLDQWREYAAQIVGGGGCGVFDPGLSVVAGPTGFGGALDGAALLTRIAPSTAHLAQLAVRAGAQARGLGRALVAHALGRAAAGGCTGITLLVHEQNTRARRLYLEAGFEERAAFLSAARDVDQPCTSSSEALPTGGASTRL